MQLRPYRSLDLEALEPRILQQTLLLPQLTALEMQAATSRFAYILTTVGGIDPALDRECTAEFFARSLLAVAGEILRQPHRILSPFRREQYSPWLERRCEVMTLSDNGERANAAAIQKAIKEWGLSLGEQADLRCCAIIAAVCSLVLDGRLPLGEAVGMLRLH